MIVAIAYGRLGIELEANVRQSERTTVKEKCKSLPTLVMASFWMGQDASCALSTVLKHSIKI